MILLSDMPGDERPRMRFECYAKRNATTPCATKYAHLCGDSRMLWIHRAIVFVCVRACRVEYPCIGIIFIYSIQNPHSMSRIDCYVIESEYPYRWLLYNPHMHGRKKKNTNLIHYKYSPVTRVVLCRCRWRRRRQHIGVVDGDGQRHRQQRWWVKIYMWYVYATYTKVCCETDVILTFVVNVCRMLRVSLHIREDGKNIDGRDLHIQTHAETSALSHVGRWWSITGGKHNWRWYMRVGKPVYVELCNFYIELYR